MKSIQNQIKHLLKQKNAVLVAHYYPPLFYRDADHKIWKILQSGNPRLTSKWHFHPIPILITNNVSFFRQQFIEEIDQNLSC
jgi:hypothetical protein